MVCVPLPRSEAWEQIEPEHNNGSMAEWGKEPSRWGTEDINQAGRSTRSKNIRGGKGMEVKNMGIQCTCELQAVINIIIRQHGEGAGHQWEGKGQEGGKECAGGTGVWGRGRYVCVGVYTG